MIYDIDAPNLECNYQAASWVIRKCLYMTIPQLKGVEIGVRYGEFSEFLLTQYAFLSMYCVDPYAPYQDVGYFYSAEEQEEIKKKAVNRLEQFPGRVHWIFSPSKEAALLCREGNFDFVFIDGEHTYESADLDIRTWAPRVRPGGLLMGHDFSMDGVKKAILEHQEREKTIVYHVLPPSDIWYIFS